MLGVLVVFLCGFGMGWALAQLVQIWRIQREAFDLSPEENERVAWILRDIAEFKRKNGWPDDRG